jgi:hypothetical protein
MAVRYFTAYGKDGVVKRRAEFRLVESTVLEIGAGCTIQD